MVTNEDKINNSIFSIPFVRSLFWIQNKWHQHGIFVHTLRVTYYTLRAGEFKMFMAALLHDIGKPSTAYVEDEEDLQYGEYSFTDHEERSYQIIKNCPFISQYTKNLVRYHYLIRDMKKSAKKDLVRYKAKKKIWDTLNTEIHEDLKLFLEFDDAGKGKKRR